MGAPVIARCDTPPVFEPSEHDLDLVPLFVERFAKVSRRAPPFPGRDAGLNVFGAQGAAELIAVITFVADQRFCAFRQRRIDQFGPDVITGLPSRQAQDQRPAPVIGDSMQL